MWRYKSSMVRRAFLGDLISDLLLGLTILIFTVNLYWIYSFQSDFDSRCPCNLMMRADSVKVFAMLVCLAAAGSLSLDSNLQLSLSANTPTNLSLTLPSEISINSSECLYIQVSSPLNDPYQQPSLTVSSGNFSRDCYGSNAEFTGVCAIDPRQLTRKEWDIVVRCEFDCRIVLRAYLSTVIVATVGEVLTLQSGFNTSQVFLLSVSMPMVNYSDVSIQAYVLNPYEVNQSLELVCNVGDNNTQLPSLDKFQYGSQSAANPGKAIILSSQELQPKQTAKVLLLLSIGMQVAFVVSTKVNNLVSLLLNIQQHDFIFYSDFKMYSLQVDNVTVNETILIDFKVYSGNPLFEIAFTADMKNILPLPWTSGQLRYELTPPLRNEYNYTGMTYIRVTSSSSYYAIEAKLQAKGMNFLVLEGMLDMVILPQEVQNFLYEDYFLISASESTLVEYTLKFEIIAGELIVELQHCLSREVNRTVTCFLNDSQTFLLSSSNPTVEHIPVKIHRTMRAYYVVFAYDVSKCSVNYQKNNKTVYFCSWLLAAQNAATADTEFQVSIAKRGYSAALQQGQLVKDVIWRDQMLFYNFHLYHFNDIDSLEFFVTVIEGKVKMAVSNTALYPIEDPTTDLRYAVSNRIKFSKKDLKLDYYLVVVGEELSTFSIGVAVRNTQKQAEPVVPMLKLDEGITVDYLMDGTTSRMDFLLQIPSTQNYTVKVDEVYGRVNLTILSSNGTLVCFNEGFSYKLECRFTAQEYSNYVAIVQGEQALSEKFSITYFAADCEPFAVNRVLDVMLNANSTLCYQFRINDLLKTYKFTTALTSLQVLSGQIRMKVCVGKNCSEWTAAKYEVIDRERMSGGCAADATCIIEVLLQSQSSYDEHYFASILEEVSNYLTIFEGMTEYVVNKSLSHADGMHFRYTTYDSSTVKIMLNTNHCSRMKYYLAVRMIESTDNTTQLDYPLYRDILATNSSPVAHLYQAIVDSENQMMVIEGSDLQDYCEWCELLISAYPYTENTVQLYTFEVEASQSQDFLFVGSAKTNYLLEDETFVYSVVTGSSQQIILTIRDTHMESANQTECFQARLFDGSFESSVVFRGDYFLVAQKSGKFYQVIVRGVAESCTYQISASTVHDSVVTVHMNVHYPLSMSDGTDRHFLYFHKNTNSFKIAEIVTAGESQLAVAPISYRNRTLQDWLDLPLKEYPFIDSTYSQFIIANTSQEFCHNCLYVITAFAQGKVQSELVVLDVETAVPLTVNGFMMDKLCVNGPDSRQYVFYSSKSFNITITMLYGQFNLSVTGPKQINPIHDQLLGSSQTFIIATTPSDDSFDYASPANKHSISVSCSVANSYVLQVKQVQTDSLRVLEGVPTVQSINGKLALEFVSLEERPSETLDVLVEVLECSVEDCSKVMVSLSGYVVAFQPAVANSEAITITQSSQSSSTTNYQLSKHRGTYYLTLSAASALTVNLVIVRQQLTHLIPSRNNLFTHEGLFELYSPNKSVMIEVYNCVNEFAVMASKNYSRLAQDDGEIMLQQVNYAGHYVISVENVYGSYFLKTSKEQSEQFGAYRIRYYYYDHNDLLPYQYIRISVREISYTLTPAGYTFSVQPIKSYLPSQFDYKVTYSLFLAKTRQAIGLQANCGMGQQANVITDYILDASQLITFTLNVTANAMQGTDLSRIAEISQNFYVGAGVVVDILTADDDSDYPKSLDLTYETLQMTYLGLQTPTLPMDRLGDVKSIMLWMVVPLLLALLFMFLALRYCIRKYYDYGHNVALVEEDNEFSLDSAPVKV